MTLAELKDELPDVKVRFQGEEVAARIEDKGLGVPLVVLPCGLSFETSWEYLLYCVNNDAVVRY